MYITIPTKDIINLNLQEIHTILKNIEEHRNFDIALTVSCGWCCSEQQITNFILNLVDQYPEVLLYLEDIDVGENVLNRAQIFATYHKFWQETGKRPYEAILESICDYMLKMGKTEKDIFAYWENVLKELQQLKGGR